MSEKRVRMPGIRGVAVLNCVDDFKPGDQPPKGNGYNDWQEWAEVQHKAGLRQTECGNCSRWKYPQELSETVREHAAKNRRGKEVTMRYRVCNDCAGKRP